MREKLIELIIKSDILCDNCGENSSSYCAEAIANHLLANGVIVPPCKVGDTVYWYGLFKQLVEGEITTVDMGVTVKIPNTDIDYDVLGRDIGKTVFLSREEAEKALEERKEI